MQEGVPKFPSPMDSSHSVLLPFCLQLYHTGLHTWPHDYLCESYLVYLRTSSLKTGAMLLSVLFKKLPIVPQTQEMLNNICLVEFVYEWPLQMEECFTNQFKYITRRLFLLSFYQNGDRKGSLNNSFTPTFSELYKF